MPSSARTAATEPTVAELMRKWRRLLEINTTEAGRQLGLSPRSIEDIEQGRSRVGDELTRLALDALIHDAAHDAECRSAALALLREKKSKNRKKTP
jgi:predicted transcriptional regulator